MMRILILISFIFVSKSLIGQQKGRYFEVYSGINYSTLQVYWLEKQQNNTNPDFKNSPDWRLLYHLGVDYVFEFNRFSFGIGVKFQEKGGKNVALSLFPSDERESNVTKFLLVNLKVQIKATEKIQIINSIMFGRDVLKFIPVNVREWSIGTGLKYNFYNKLWFGVLFTQGLNNLDFKIYPFEVRNVTFEGSIFYCF
jgi:hypothetical protein